MEHKTQRVYRILLGVVLVNIAIVLFCALYKSTAVVAWRNELGGVAKYMQFDRVYWLIPVLWYLAFGAAMYLLCVLPGQRRRLWAVGVTGICIMITGGYVLWNSTFKSNVRQMLSPDTSNAVTWEKFYSEDLFAEIDTYIARPKEEYRVLSLGINPAVALYNEFYCLDGYSNNYDIDYKHKFRKIIESEITDSAAIAQYFDTWGNRCYLFTEELGIQYSINKNSGIQLHNLSVNVKQAAEMGCEYIFSGVEVSNADEVGLSFLEHFTLESSIYEVWLYGIQ